MNTYLIEFFQLFAKYKLSQAKDPLAIAEQEYASAGTIQFTKFTSCIGVIAKAGSTLTAVHLVAVSSKDHVFCTNDADRVIGCLPRKPDAVTIVGSIADWDDPANGRVLTAAFQKLTGLLQNLRKEQRGDGTYGAQINGSGQIEVYSA